jgi:nicotinate-nucleotide--dimethylbenzimidazole phosphoribosyltransferase
VTDLPVVTLAELAGTVDDPTDAEAAAGADLDALAAADGSWGQLAEVARWLATCQVRCPPTTPRLVRAVAFDAATIAGSDTVAELVSLGAAAADRGVDSGADLFVLADTSAPIGALAAIAVLTGSEPVALVLRGAAVPPAVWARQVEALRDLRRRSVARRDDPEALLTAIVDGDPDARPVAAAAGFLLASATRHTPVLLDGVTPVAAALVGRRLAPAAARWWRPIDSSAHPAHRLACTALGTRPILDLGAGNGDGALTDASLAVLDAAVRRAAAPLGS